MATLMNSLEADMGFALLKAGSVYRTVEAIMRRRT
jgi:hypothetical protein